MKTFTIDRSIDAPVDTVWRVMADVARWPEWTASMKEVRPVGTGPLGVGSRVFVSQPKLPANEWLVTEWNEGRGFTWTQHGVGLTVTAIHALTPTPTGCAVRLTLTFGGFFGMIAGPLGRAITEEYMAFEADGLKARAEGRR